MGSGVDPSQNSLNIIKNEKKNKKNKSPDKLAVWGPDLCFYLIFRHWGGESWHF